MSSRNDIRMLTEGVSVILPFKNAAERLPSFFKALASCEVLEVLACDLGSSDASFALAREHGAHAFRATSGFSQAAEGLIRTARGTALWFLDPAAEPPPYAAHYILDALALADIVGGYFPLVAAGGGLAHRWRTFMANRTAAWTGTGRLENGPFFSRRGYAVAGGVSPGPRPFVSMLKKAKTVGKLFVIPEPIRLHAER